MNQANAWKRLDVASVEPDSADASFYRTLIRSTVTEKNKRKRVKKTAGDEGGDEVEGADGDGALSFSLFLSSAYNIF